NITDVEDKILARAKELGEEPTAFSARMWASAEQDLFAIGCKKPDLEPKVSTHMAEIIDLIEKIVAGGHGYVSETPKGKDGDFSVRSFPPYTKLSHRKLDDLMAG